MNAVASFRTTHWVGRLALLMTGSLVLLRTVLTADGFGAALRFDPQFFTQRPWTLLTYPLVHESVLHLGLVLALLLLLGPLVERRLGSRAFLVFWGYCTIGTALASIAVASVLPVAPLSGGLAPVLGVAFAHGWFAEDEELALDPLPIRVRVRILIVALAAAFFVTSLVSRDSALSLAHLSGLPAAWVFLRIRSVGRRPALTPPLPMRRPVMAPIRLEVEAGTTSTAASPPPAPAPVRDLRSATSDDINRVLDKISAQGMDSLTEEERRILTEYAERKRRERSS
jgi:rhomboid family protein